MRYNINDKIYMHAANKIEEKGIESDSTNNNAKKKSQNQQLQLRGLSVVG